MTNCESNWPEKSHDVIKQRERDSNTYRQTIPAWALVLGTIGLGIFVASAIALGWEAGYL